jgi:hypothetical protein
LVEERGTTIALTRLYGGAPHDHRARGSVPRNPGKHTTLGAARAPDGRHVPWLLEGARETATFVWYLTEHLAPTLRPRQVVVRDNVRVHKAARIRQVIEARPCTRLFLPSSSPDCTPLEPAFSTLTAILRRLGARTTEALWEAMQVAVAAITQEAAAAWFAQAGYALPAQPT